MPLDLSFHLPPWSQMRRRCTAIATMKQTAGYGSRWWSCCHEQHRTSSKYSVLPQLIGSLSCRAELEWSAGGANAVDGCVVLSMERMDRILSVDADDLTAIVDPASSMPMFPKRPCRTDYSTFLTRKRYVSTLGGNIATNAGACAVSSTGSLAITCSDLRLFSQTELSSRRDGGPSRVGGYDLTQPIRRVRRHPWRRYAGNAAAFTMAPPLLLVVSFPDL